MTHIDPTPTKKNNAEGKTLASIYRVATIILGAALAVVAFYLFLAIQLGAWQMYALSAVIAGFVIANVVAILIIRKGNSDRGSWIIIFGMMVVFPAAVLLIDGISVIFGVTLFALVATVSTQTLNAEKARRANIYAAVTGLLTALLGLVQLNYRLLVPQIQAFVPAITVIIVLVVLFFAIRQSWSSIVNFWRASIRNRLTMIILVTAIIPVVLLTSILGATSYIQTRDALIADSFDRLSAIEEIKTSQLSNYFDDRNSDMIALSDSMGSLLSETLNKMEALNTLKRNQIIQLFQTWDADVRDVASNPDVVLGLREMANGFRTLGVAEVRSLYLGDRDLTYAGDASAYSTSHRDQHDFFSKYIDIHGYEDAYLIDLNGNIVYSVNKTEVFGTNLLSSNYQDSSLAKLYGDLLTAPVGTSYIADVALFEENYAMFIGAPVYDGSTLVGVLAYQLPLNTIRNIMAERTGQGLTGESFLLAMDKEGNISYRSDRTSLGNDRFVIGYDITDIASPTMRKALAGESGGGLIAASTGETRVNAYKPLDIEGLNWVVFTSVNATEALSPTHIAGEKDYLATYREDYDYYDIFLIHPNGTIFYTVAQEADYGTNILTGPFSNSTLSTLVSEVLEEKETAFADFSFYEPSGDIPAAFFATPVLNAEGNVVLIVATQIDKKDINEIMNEASGLGETGETYIIGQDFLGRMDSRFIDQFEVETTILNPDFSVDTEAVRSALAGESGQGTIIDYRGLPVLSVWKPFVVHSADPAHPEGQIWAVMTEIDQSEAEQAPRQLARSFALILSLATLAVAAVAVFLGTRFAVNFVEPILNLTDTATEVAAGNLSLRAETDSEDEIGTLTNTFNTMTAQLEETLGGLEERVAARTKDLATVANISTVTATIRDSEEMLTNMVHLTQRGFGLYHAHVFTFDKNEDMLSIVACGYREGDEHEGTHGTTTIPLGQEQSLVALCARTRQPVIVNDVRNEPGWLPNPLLPETRSELAVPMLVGDELLGVLDVQSEKLDAFTEEDANIQMTLAAQIATALQNVRTYEQAQKRAELESLVNVIGQRVQRSSSIEETLQIAIRELGTAIGAKRVKASIKPAPESDGHLSTDQEL